MEDLEIHQFSMDAGWSDDWMKNGLTPRGKAKARAAAPVTGNSSILVHAVPTPARVVPVPNSAATRPLPNAETSEVTGLGAANAEGNAVQVTGSRDADQTTGTGLGANDDETTGNHGDAAMQPGAPQNEGNDVEELEAEQILQEPLEQPCMICLNAMSSSEQNLTALQCGHTVHTACVTRYMAVSQKPIDECCPLRCHQSPPMLVPLQVPEPGNAVIGLGAAEQTGEE